MVLKLGKAPFEVLFHHLLGQVTLDKWDNLSQPQCNYFVKMEIIILQREIVK